MRTCYGSRCTVDRCTSNSHEIFRLIGSDRGAALPSRLQTFETELLAEGELRGAGTGKPRADRQGRRDRFAAELCWTGLTEIPVYDRSYNGHFESCYHPLLLFNREGDCLAAKLPGNVHSAEDGRTWEIERQSRRWCFVPTPPSPNQVYEALEELKYAIRIPANDSLQRDIEDC